MATESHFEGRSASTRVLGLAGLALLIVALWLLMHPFRGVEHDSTLYTLLAQARLHPQSLGHDLFVQYGTQNSFTVFSPIYAELIRLIGMERAAAVLTFLTHVGFFGCAWLLARRFMSSSRALLGTGLLAVLPAYYGHGEVFAFTESFITPRQPAEVFVLAAIIAMLGSRRLIAAAWLTAAVLLHPIIAAPGVLLCLLLKFGVPRPRRAAVVLAAGMAAFLVIATAVPVGPFIHFDVQWLTVLQQRLVYLFPTRWGAADFGGVTAPLAVLIVGSCAATDRRLRNLCLTTTVTVLFGLASGVIGGDVLHIALASQLQTWRWLWLSMVLAIALSPIIAVNCWRAGPLLRAAAVLLLSAWLTSSDAFSLLPAGLACICALLHPHSIAPQRAGARGAAIQNSRFIEIGAWAVAAMGIVILVQTDSTFSQLQTLHPARLLYDTRVREAQVLCLTGIVPALLLVLAACALERQVTQTSLLIGILGIIACLVLLPYGIRTWTRIRYPAERHAAFEPWRQAVAPATEVLWPDPPADEWFLLERSSYWSLYQMAGMVFSREVTMIGTQRETAVAPVLPLIRSEPADLVGAGERPPAHSLAEVCRVPGVKFFASWNDLGATPYPALAPDANQPERLLRLYRCGPTAG